MTNSIYEKLAASKKYAALCPDTLRRVAEDCAQRYKKPKEAEKAARETLHGITGAFMGPEELKRAEERLPLFLAAPIQHKFIVCEPLLERVDLSLYLTPAIEEVIAGGESGYDARLCDFAWIQELREQCVAARVPFHFKQTGAHFRKDGRVYRIERRHQHSQAAKADIEYRP